MPHREDPYMINPKGVKVQIPLEEVEHYITRGFKLEDETFDYKKALLEEEEKTWNTPMTQKNLSKEELHLILI